MPASAVLVKKRGGVLSKPAAAHFWGSVGVNNDGEARVRTTVAQPHPVLALCMLEEERIPRCWRPWRSQFAHSRSPGLRQLPLSRPKTPHSRRHCRRAQPSIVRPRQPAAGLRRHAAGMAKGEHAQGRDLLPGLAFKFLKAQVVDEGSRSH
jgi:hypothetical protein